MEVLVVIRQVMERLCFEKYGELQEKILDVLLNVYVCMSVFVGLWLDIQIYYNRKRQEEILRNLQVVVKEKSNLIGFLDIVD